MSVPQQDFPGIKQVLIARRDALRERHRRVELDLQRRNDPLVGDWSDRAVQVQNDEALQVIDDATQDELATVDEALQRLDLGLYGTCKECGESIEPGRLRALHAVTCAACASD
jgi:RNA polymerase-binding transcription factor DksA